MIYDRIRNRYDAPQRREDETWQAAVTAPRQRRTAGMVKMTPPSVAAAAAFADSL